MPGEREEPRQLQAESLFAAWASRVEAGEELDFEDVVRANAELERELRALHDDWKHFAPILGNVVPGLIASGDGLVLPSLTRGPDVDEGPPSDELLEKLGLHAPDAKRYRFRGRIGTGGQGVVLKVWDAKLSRPLAMKIVLGSAQDQPTGQTPRVDGRRLTRFVDEARIASQLNHPGIVPVHELGADESGRAFFTMKLVKGDDLSRIFDKAKRGEDGIGLPRAVSYLLRVCEAMAYAHARGVIHRDLKPANVMVGAYGDVHVMDWGLARVIGDAASAESSPRAHATGPSSQVDSVRRADREASPDSPFATELSDQVGTPCYMSPEQARGDNAAVGPQSDVYAVGAMLYQLLTGTPPYVPPGERLSALAILRQTIHGPPPPVESLAPRAIPELVAICERAMARDPAARYASMRALAADLQAFLENRVVRAYETGAWAETRKWVKRNRALTVAIAATVAVSIFGAIAAMNLASEANRNAKRALDNEQASMRHAEAAERAAYEALILSAQIAAQAGEPEQLRRALDAAPSRLRDWEWRHINAQSDTSACRIVASLGYCGAVALDHQGERVAIELADRSTLIADAVTGEPVATLQRTEESISQSAFSSDGALVATASSDLCARVWDASTGVVRMVFSGHSRPLRSAAINPQGTEVATISEDGSARLWSVRDGLELLRLSGRAANLRRIAYDSTGDVLFGILDDDTESAWDTRTGSELENRDRGVPEIWRVDGERADNLEIEDRWVSTTVRIAEIPFESDAVKLVGHAGLLCALAFSGNRKRVATRTYWDDAVRIWNTSPELLPRSELRVTSPVYVAEFSPDGGRLFVGGAGGQGSLWDVSSGRQLAAMLGHGNTIKSADFSDDGRRIVTTAGDRRGAVIWDVDTGQAIMRLAGHGEQMWFAEFSPDGRQVLTTSWDASASLWSAADGDEIRRLAPPPSCGENPHCVARFTPQGVPLAL